jgi:hypothetical protein
VRDAIQNSTVVASFGTGNQMVDVRQIHPQGQQAAEREITAASNVRKTLGTQLAQNPALQADAGTKSQFRAGQVDSRAMIALGQVLADRFVQVDRLTPLTGEEGSSFRRVVLRTASTTAAVNTEKTLDALAKDYRAESVERDGDTLTVTWSRMDPTTTAVTAS